MPGIGSALGLLVYPQCTQLRMRLAWLSAETQEGPGSSNLILGTGSGFGGSRSGTVEHARAVKLVTNEI